jgi:Concanavalin A-like lectin/glucanases superfamily
MKLLVAFLALLLGNPATYADQPRAGVPTGPEPAFVFRFDRPPDVVGEQQRYPADGALGAVGGVLTVNRGAVERVPDESGGVALRFPAPCRGPGAGCPRAIVDVPHSPGLNPGDRSFSFGAMVLLSPDETTDGSNVMQKGRFRTPGAQWKLQIDGIAGRPSCVFRGGPGRRGPSVTATSPVSVATGSWHSVRCVLTADQAAVVVDGLTASVRAASVRALSNTAPVRLGGPGLDVGDDQYHGRLDDVFLRIPAG